MPCTVSPWASCKAAIYENTCTNTSSTHAHMICDPAIWFVACTAYNIHAMHAIFLIFLMVNVAIIGIVFILCVHILISTYKLVATWFFIITVYWYLQSFNYDSWINHYIEYTLSTIIKYNFAVDSYVEAVISIFKIYFCIIFDALFIVYYNLSSHKSIRTRFECKFAINWSISTIFA